MTTAASEDSVERIEKIFQPILTVQPGTIVTIKATHRIRSPTAKQPADGEFVVLGPVMRPGKAAPVGICVAAKEDKEGEVLPEVFPMGEQFGIAETMGPEELLTCDSKYVREWFGGIINGDLEPSDLLAWQAALEIEDKGRRTRSRSVADDTESMLNDFMDMINKKNLPPTTPQPVSPIWVAPNQDEWNRNKYTLGDTPGGLDTIMCSISKSPEERVELYNRKLEQTYFNQKKL